LPAPAAKGNLAAASRVGRGAWQKDVSDLSDPFEDAETTVEKVDVAVTEAVAEQAGRPWVKVLGQLSEVADQPPMRVLTLGTAAVGLALRDPRLTRAGLRMFAAHTLATWTKTAIKRRVDRTRPDVALEDRYRMERGGSQEHGLSSFPSGHTAGALAVTQALARDYPGSRAAGFAFSAWAGAMQVPRCKHFVSDIAAGALVGWAAEAISSRLFDRAERALAG
jgi:membrane-associated phospholipid phosphatase